MVERSRDIGVRDPLDEEREERGEELSLDILPVGLCKMSRYLSEKQRDVGDLVWCFVEVGGEVVCFMLLTR